MILIALGANLPSPAGPPAATLDAALEALGEAGDIRVLKRSRLYRSLSWPDASLPEYRNAVADIGTSLDPLALLERLHGIEARFGRLREAIGAPRPLDLDLLDYHGVVRTEAPLLPHPRMRQRAFVLLPLVELAPDWRHPISRQPLQELIDLLSAQLRAGAVPV